MLLEKLKALECSLHSDKRKDRPSLKSKGFHAAPPARPSMNKKDRGDQPKVIQAVCQWVFQAVRLRSPSPQNNGMQPFGISI